MRGEPLVGSPIALPVCQSHGVHQFRWETLRQRADRTGVRHRSFGYFLYVDDGYRQIQATPVALLVVLNWVHSHWHLIHWGDASAYLGVIVTAVFGFMAYRSKRDAETAKGEAESAKGEAERQAELADTAARAAQDAAAAAERSANAAERQAKAHETVAQLAQDQADAAQQKPWDIEHHGGMDYRLRNLTRTPKYDVVVTGEPTGRNPKVFRPGGGRHENSFEMVDGAETVELDLFVVAQTRERFVMVSWRPT